LLPPPFPPVIGVRLPFLVFVSAMGVLISLVAIPLRENVPNFLCRCTAGALELLAGNLRFGRLRFEPA